MKKALPLAVIHRLFSAAALLLFVALAAFLTYLYVAFSGPLIGDVSVGASPDLLSKLDERKLELVIARQKTRENLPDIPADLPDPFKAVQAP